MRRALGAIGLALLLTAATAGYASTTIPWTDAAAHVGEQVTVEGNVASARVQGPTLIIEFAANDPQAFHVVLLIPLITDLPRQPDRLYVGKRIRASGTIRRFAGRPEMILRTPDAIQVIDIATGGSAVASTPTTTLPGAPAAPPATTPPSLPAVATAPPPTEPPAAAEAEAPRWPLGDRCANAKDRWREVAATARERAVALTRCLEGDSFRCRPVAAALAPALTDLEWAEQQVEAACPR
jgi:hypothetical protein